MRAYPNPLACMTVLLHFLAGPLIYDTGRAAEVRPFQCRLTLPGSETSAAANVTFRVHDKELYYTLTVQNLSDVTMAHLHLGHKGGISTPVVWLYPPAPPPKLIPGPVDGILAQGAVTAKDLVGPLRGQPLSALIKEMEAGKTYVNIHTKGHPEGSLCGLVELSGQ